MTEHTDTDGNNKQTISKSRREDLFKHLNKNFDVEYTGFCIEIIGYIIEDYNNVDLKSHSNYNEYKYAQNDALKAYELYTVCKGDKLDKYRSTLHALWIDLNTIARNTYQDIPSKKSRGRPKTTALRNDLIVSIYRLYDPDQYGLKSENSHFEKTVRMVLSWVEYDAPQDLHSLIMRASKVTEIK